ncbi:MAG: ABC transporter substrate-binding protein, partial [Desulfuromonadales bacterium]|nr:ABC transporter substrate-binding protein [Desulfuromonadales bacterium]
KQNPEAAQKAVQRLLDQEVVAILGPMTSSMAMVVHPQINSSEVVMISPTVKTTQLSGLDDNFFRTTVALDRNARKMAAHVVEELGVRKFAVIFDQSNRAFTETWRDVFVQELTARGGEAVFVEGLDEKGEVHFLPIAKRIVASDAKGVLLLSNAIDTALMAQQIRKLGSELPLFASEWAFTTDLIGFGGRAVNGMTSFHSINVESQNPRYLTFKEKFAKRYGYAPSFATILAYDAADYLFLGLEQQSTATDLKKALLKVSSFPGLQSTINVDPSGDVDRQLFLTVVGEGKFKVVE